jgi:peptide/nickel transport system substrate-binding protein
MKTPSFRRFARLLVAAGVGAALALGSAAHARDLRVAMPVEPTSIDPAAMVQPYNATISLHLYDGLIRRSPDMKLQPGLATAWKAVDDTTWEFELRKGVKWHDGGDFTAADVIATVDRIKALNVPVSFRLYTSTIATMTAPNPNALRITTNGPDPLLPGKMSFLFITPAKVKGSTSAEFNAGSATIGTGPYKFTEYVTGQRIVMTKNPAYWGEAPAFDRIVFSMVPNEASRVAALLANNTDLVLDLSPDSVAQLKNNRNLNVSVGPQDRVIGLFFNFGDTLKYVKAKDGSALTTNPFKDIRVRRAFTKAIDRDAIVSRVLDNLGKKEGQIFPTGYSGSSPNLQPEKFDLPGARALMKEAGYPQGFGVTLVCTAGRFMRDKEACEAVAAMLAQIGVQVTVQAVPFNVHTQMRLTKELNFFLYSAGTGWGEILSSFVAVVPTPNPALRMGSANSNNYSNAEVDKLLQAAVRTIDDRQRAAMQARAMEMYVRDDVATAPLFRQSSIAAMKKDLRYETREDGMFNALHVKPAK